MIRFRIGIGILAALLAFGIGVQLWTEAACAPIVRALDAAQTAAEAGQWERAENCRTEAQSAWQSRWRILAALADHQPMEDIDGLLAQMRVYGREKSEGEYAAAAAELSRRIAAMADAHRFRWWNLF